jgi:hypothetical protein
MATFDRKQTVCFQALEHEKQTLRERAQERPLATKLQTFALLTILLRVGLRDAGELHLGRRQSVGLNLDNDLTSRRSCTDCCHRAAMECLPTA